MRLSNPLQRRERLVQTLRPSRRCVLRGALSAACFAAVGRPMLGGHLSEEQPLLRAAKYLWSQQHHDGSWRSRHYAMLRSGQALTPFVLHALLGVPSDVFAPPKRQIESAVDFIRNSVDERGAIGFADEDLLEYPNYSTAYAIKCLLTVGDAADEELITRMATFLLGGQYGEQNGFAPSHLAYGGWGFAPPVQSGVAGHMDLAHTRHVLEALRLADEKLPTFSADADVYQHAEAFLRLVQKQPAVTRPHPIPSTWTGSREQWQAGAANAFDGGFYFSPIVLAANKAGYASDPPHWRSYATATCDGLLGLRAIGADDDDARVVAARKWLLDNNELNLPVGIPRDQPVAWAESIRFYHYAVRSRVLAHRPGANDDRIKLQRLIAAHQHDDGRFANAHGHLMKEDDPLVCTGLATEALSHAS